jgi:quinol monooxygenase YgiN
MVSFLHLGSDGGLEEEREKRNKANVENRFVMQDTKDPRAFTIVERYAHESVSLFQSQQCIPIETRVSIIATTDTKSKQSQKYHLENPYWQTFDKYVIPLLAKDMDLRRLNELVDDKSEQVRVEQDPKLWEEVKKHQTY